MRSLLKFAFIVILSSCGGSNNDLTESFQSSISRYSQQYHIPGIVAGIWVPGKNPVVVEYGIGNMDLHQQVQRSDHSRIASITKSFTVTVLLQLAQSGQIDLQKPLSFYLPNLAIHNNNATIFELATMRSGIFGYAEDPSFLPELFGAPLNQVTDSHLVAIANNNPPYFSPGTDWHYSDTNTVILGMLVEAITGNTIAEEITNRIIIPAGLNQTSYPLTPNMPAPFMSGYLFDSSTDFTLVDPSYSGASGAMISTLDDLRKWATTLGEGQLLSDDMRDRLRQSLTPVTFSPCADNIVFRAKVSCPEYDAYGLGLGQINGWIGHTGDYIGYQALMMYSPKTKAVVVILTNLSFQNDPALGATHVPTTMFREWVLRKLL